MYELKFAFMKHRNVASWPALLRCQVLLNQTNCKWPHRRVQSDKRFHFLLNHHLPWLTSLIKCRNVLEMRARVFPTLLNYYTRVMHSNGFHCGVSFMCIMYFDHVHLMALCCPPHPLVSSSSSHLACPLLSFLFLLFFWATEFYYGCLQAHGHLISHWRDISHSLSQHWQQKRHMGSLAFGALLRGWSLEWHPESLWASPGPESSCAPGVWHSPVMDTHHTTVSPRFVSMGIQNIVKDI